MEDGRLPARSVTQLRPRILATRLLIVVAAVLGVLAMHATAEVGTAARAGGRPVAVSAVASAYAATVAATVAASSDSDRDGCCCTTACETMSTTCGTRLAVNEFTVSAIATAVTALQSVAESDPAAGPVPAQGPPSRPIGLALAALAVSRI